MVQLEEHIRESVVLTGMGLPPWICGGLGVLLTVSGLRNFCRCATKWSCLLSSAELLLLDT